MSLGKQLRRALGSRTDPVARWYRSYYIDIADFGRTLSRLEGVATVLEVGCGDGHLCEAISAYLPEAQVLGIDIDDDPGRLFAGDADRVRFRQVPAETLLEEGDSFDLVVLCDVLHHVSPPHRPPLLATARALTAPGGHLVVKDWEISRNAASAAAWFSDRYITGDRIAFFPSRASLVDVVAAACPADRIVAEGRVPPQWNNLYLVVRAAPDQTSVR